MMFFEKRSQPIRGSGSSYTLSSGQMVLGSGYISADRALKNSDVWTAVILSVPTLHVLSFMHRRNKKLINC
ncbi:hypothetical protein KMD26_gp35 [Leuconostoc phage phiMH1]|uniref:Uncharacterized protein n=1 Tax=Leuconostoc phage phiMH1 TaxID=912321 RepID=E3W8F2_9CAUD|nr:hypothetical protein KMD26_gp35 [Leuconostoc phage phiMH1]ADP69219.1 hypothetical protein [Leuconostoc phage phiMH1]